MDESKLSKSDANRKPQDWWIYEQYNQAAELGIIRMATKERFSKENREQFSETHCKEVLPQDDSIRVSREDWKEIKSLMKFASDSYHVEVDVAKIIERIERIERESKGGL